MARQPRAPSRWQIGSAIYFWMSKAKRISDLIIEKGPEEARFDWSYSDQAQYDVITKKGCHWSRSSIGAREVPATGPAAFSRLPQHQQPSTFGQNIQDIPYFPQRFACHALLSRSVTVRAHLVSLYIEFAAVSIYCYAFYFFFGISGTRIPLFRWQHHRQRLGTFSLAHRPNLCLSLARS